MRSILPRTAVPISRGEVLVALRGLLQGNTYAREDTARFESEMAKYLAAKKASACNSGRTALYLALQALNTKTADEIIVPAYVCAIVFEVILRLGLKPVLVDVEPETFNINPELIPKATTAKTRAIVPVHLFGRPSEMDRITEIAHDYGLYVIEDCAQALGAEYKGRKVGNFGDLAIFSLGPGKSITSGEGGVVAVNNKEVLEGIENAKAELVSPNLGWNLHLMRNILAMRIFANPRLYRLVRGRIENELDQKEAKTLENCERLAQKKDVSGLHPTVRLANMPPFAARIAKSQLQKIDELNEKRIENAARLTMLLSEASDFIQLPQKEEFEKSTFTRYPVRILNGSRDVIRRKMFEYGVDSERPYYYLADYLNSKRIEAPQAVQLALSTITIPNHPLMKENALLKTAGALKAALAAN